jgi:hypothetical protein
VEGELSPWASKERLAEVLRAGGLRVYVGPYSVRVEDCSHFQFEHYGGDLGAPHIDAEADSVEQMQREAAMVSVALARAGLRHRFEILDGHGNEIAHLHHDWPAPPT